MYVHVVALFVYSNLNILHMNKYYILSGTDCPPLPMSWKAHRFFLCILIHFASV